MPVVDGGEGARSPGPRPPASRPGSSSIRRPRRPPWPAQGFQSRSRWRSPRSGPAASPAGIAGRLAVSRRSPPDRDGTGGQTARPGRPVSRTCRRISVIIAASSAIASSKLALDQTDHRLSRRRPRLARQRGNTASRPCGALTRITFTGLFASVQGPSGASASSIRAAKPWRAGSASPTGARAARRRCQRRTSAGRGRSCCPVVSDGFIAAYSSSAVALHGFQRGAARRFGGRDDRAFDDRRIADDDACRAAPPSASRSPSPYWSPRRRDRPGSRRPPPTRPLSIAAMMRRDVGAEAAVGIPAGPGERARCRRPSGAPCRRRPRRPSGNATRSRSRRSRHRLKLSRRVGRRPRSSAPRTARRDPCGRSTARPRNEARPRIAFIGHRRRRQRPIAAALTASASAPSAERRVHRRPARRAWSSARRRTCRAP